MFYFDNIKGKKILRSDLIKGANTFFTTRESFIKTKDEKSEKIASDNRKLICDYLEITSEQLISPSQTHSNNVSTVTKNITEYPETDGLILNDTKNAIFLNFADCTPLVFYDKKLNIGAVSHAGWRGTAGKISVVTLEKLQKDFGCKPENIQAVIGPAISFCCYNVGEDVYNRLKATVKNPQGLFEKRNDELFVDLKNINKRQLIEAGVKEIDVCPYCTVCNNDIFFSYRKENATTDRHSAILKLINK